ncbi:MAG: hypothetical protein H0V34_10510 [Gammaproteobacteria bacterium]|nr:hypothetical protein [Gammaproteobacteria bacterium]MBA3730818.1 hypothetical protein [Gammaproteobacteria bacterium]
MSNGDQRVTNQQDRNGSGKRKVPLLEWIVSLLGLVLVIGTSGLMIYYAFYQQGTPPRLRAAGEGVTSIGDRYLLEFTVYNDGGASAAMVNIAGGLKRDGKTIESASVTFDYVPAHSSASGGMLFARDPRSYQIRLGAKAYMEP